MNRCAIIGTVGVPGSYGGFETLAENLVRYHASEERPEELVVYCSSKATPDGGSKFLTAELRYVPVEANGAASLLYDLWSMLSAIRNQADVIVLLGVPGALALPVIRLFSDVRIITNIDGMEWKRDKWSSVARRVLRICESLAVRYSHEVISDNEAIRRYVLDAYGRQSHVIAYGGDHALEAEAADISDLGLPGRYALALCRIEPENNVEMTLEAFSGQREQPLVFVGNWNRSEYGTRLRSRFTGRRNMYLLDALYDPGRLRAVRERAWIYVHGHSAGGTNPALVEMMHFGIPVAAYDCDFNRETTGGSAQFYSDSASLRQIVETLSLGGGARGQGLKMSEIARCRYTWGRIGEAYFELISSGGNVARR